MNVLLHIVIDPPSHYVERPYAGTCIYIVESLCIYTRTIDNIPSYLCTNIYYMGERCTEGTGHGSQGSFYR